VSSCIRRETTFNNSLLLTVELFYRQDPLRKAKFLIRKQKFIELCSRSENCIEALEYLQTEVSEIVDHENHSEVESFHGCAKFLMDGDNSMMELDFEEDRFEDEDAGLISDDEDHLLILGEANNQVKLNALVDGEKEIRSNLPSVQIKNLLPTTVPIAVDEKIWKLRMEVFEGLLTLFRDGLIDENDNRIEDCIVWKPHLSPN
jgi:hypothetical protein